MRRRRSGRRSTSVDSDCDFGRIVARDIAGRFTILPEEEQAGAWIHTADPVEIRQ